MTTNAGRLAVVTEFKKPKMNKEQFLLELAKVLSADGRVSVDKYAKTVELVDAYISSNYSKPNVIRRLFDVKFHSSYAVWHHETASYLACDEAEALDKFWANKNKESYEVMSVQCRE